MSKSHNQEKDNTIQTHTPRIKIIQIIEVSALITIMPKLYLNKTSSNRIIRTIKIRIQPLSISMKMMILEAMMRNH